MGTRDPNRGERPSGAEHPSGPEPLAGAHELEELNRLLRACAASERDQCWIAYLLGAQAMARVLGEPKPPGLDPTLLRAIASGAMSLAQAIEIDALADRLIEIGRGVIPEREIDPETIERLASEGERY